MRWPVLCAALVLALPLHSALAASSSRSNEIPEPAILRGRVLDASGGAIVGAQVVVNAERPGGPVVGVTNHQGEFLITVSPGAYVVRITATGFLATTRRVALVAGTTTADFALQVAGVQESVTVDAPRSYDSPALTSATRTATALRDIPQSISIASSALISDSRMASIADAVRYMPGVGIAQGEGNRDTPILRGNSSTADFFVDGIRDDVQYFRDVYNVERVEALKGPNAMVFGRGGAGGVINRVTRQAEWGQPREMAFQIGSWNNKRLTADVGKGLNEGIALRASTVYEQSDTYRTGVAIERYGLNPSVAFRPGAATTIRASYEHFHDRRTADRGISSVNGRPVETDAATFFGDPDQSESTATINVFSSLVEHHFNPRVTLRTRVSYGDYDKFYQNVFPGAVNAAAATVAISAYNNATRRRNLFNQTDLIVSASTGRLRHTALLGTEFGRQESDNFRETGFFSTLGPNAVTYDAPLSAPTISLPLAFRQSATDADNHGIAQVAALYLQDQIALSDRLEAVLGVRFDSFRVNFTNNRSLADFSSSDELWSPRAGLIYRPVPSMSLYGSHSLTYLPRAGEQMTSLSLTNQSLEPEEFRNYEVGAKWELTPGFALTAALYRLDRGNVAVPDPTDPAVSLLVDAQRTRGAEVEVNGRIGKAWHLAGGYAYQNGEITRSISAAAQAGASLAQLPRHSLSLWNKYDITPRLSAGLGVIHRTAMFTSTDNLVLLPKWTRVDGAVFYNLTSKLRAQINIDNLFNERYYLNAHSNTNITPGSPRAVKLTLTTKF